MDELIAKGNSQTNFLSPPLPLLDPFLFILIVEQYKGNKGEGEASDFCECHAPPCCHLQWKATNFTCCMRCQRVSYCSTKCMQVQLGVSLSLVYCRVSLFFCLLSSPSSATYPFALYSPPLFSIKHAPPPTTSATVFPPLSTLLPSPSLRPPFFFAPYHSPFSPTPCTAPLTHLLAASWSRDHRVSLFFSALTVKVYMCSPLASQFYQFLPLGVFAICLLFSCGLQPRSFKLLSCFLRYDHRITMIYNGYRWTGSDTGKTVANLERSAAMQRWSTVDAHVVPTPWPPIFKRFYFLYKAHSVDRSHFLCK